MKKLGYILILFVFAAALVGYWYSKDLEAKPHQSMSWVNTYEIKSGTAEMVKLLDSIQRWQIERERINTKLVWYKRIGHLFYKPITTKIHEARDLLHHGETNKTIEILEALSSEVQDAEEVIQFQYQELLGIAYLRWGEQENCIINHSNNSCIMPIQGDGIYTLQENTRKAIAVYEKLLELRPNEWIYRWLINVAYQTLGEYPDSVPEQWLIQSEFMQDKDSHDNFTNIAPMLKVDDRTGAGGAVMEDFNNDGLLDIISSGLLATNQIHYYVNNGSAGFSDQTDNANLMGLTCGFNIYPLDYNNDGWKDLFVVRGSWGRNYGLYPNSLLKNNQDGTFSDVTVESGMLSFKPVATAVCADFNNDGWTDIYIGNESRANSEFDFGNELFLNSGDGKFKNVAAESGAKVVCFTKGLCAADYNNDRKMDIFVSNHNGRNYLLKNKGNNAEGIPQFEDVSNSAGLEEQSGSFTPWFWDYNNDGWLDLFVTSFEYGRGSSAASAAKHFAGEKDSTSRAHLYHNNGDGTFSNRAEDLGLDFPLSTMGANFGDINNDGWLDFYIGTGEPDYMGIHPNRLLINQEGEGFEDKTFELGVGHIQKGHGISFGDIDRDGDQDILAEMGGEYPGDEFQNALFQNPGNNNNWIILRLEGTTSSRDALGAKIKLALSRGDSTQVFYRVVSSGGSFGSNSLQQEIGIGSYSQIDSVVITWPNSKNNDVLKELGINKCYLIKEGSKKAMEQSYTSIDYSKLSSHKMHH